MFIKNSLGFSLPEVLVAIGITGAVAVGGMQLMKNIQTSKKQVDAQQSSQTIQKLVEGQLFSPQGCKNLEGLRSGQSFALKMGKIKYGAGSKIGRVSIIDLKYAEFIPSDEEGVMGIARIQLTINKGDKQNNTVEIPVPVSLSDDSSIEACDLYQTSAYAAVYNDLCSDSFGTVSKGRSCADVLALLEELALKSICEDIYGIPANAKYVNGHCNLQLTHANQKCATGKGVQSFNANGEILCADVPQPECSAWSGWGPSSANACTNKSMTQTRSCTDGVVAKTESRTVQGTGTGANCCTSWSAWTPDTSTQCTDVTMTQTRSCKAGSSATETRSTSGAKKPGNWTPDASTVCSGRTFTQTNGCDSRTVNGVKNCATEKWNVYCFVAGTQVTLKNGDTQSIEKLQVGDEVLTYDEKAGANIVRPVKEVLHHMQKVSTLYTFTFLNGKTVTSNDQHRFYIADSGEYLAAGEIYQEWRRGSFINVLTEEGNPILITGIKESHDMVDLYNIHVNGVYDSAIEEKEYNHNYFANGILVHNEKKEWNNEDLQSRAIACCKNPEYKVSYPRGIFCTGTKEEHDAWTACSWQSR